MVQQCANIGNAIVSAIGHVAGNDIRGQIQLVVKEGRGRSDVKTTGRRTGARVANHIPGAHRALAHTDSDNVQKLRTGGSGFSQRDRIIASAADNGIGATDVSECIPQTSTDQNISAGIAAQLLQPGLAVVNGVVTAEVDHVTTVTTHIELAR